MVAIRHLELRKNTRVSQVRPADYVSTPKHQERLTPKNLQDLVLCHLTILGPNKVSIQIVIFFKMAAYRHFDHPNDTITMKYPFTSLRAHNITE